MRFGRAITTGVGGFVIVGLAGFAALEVRDNIAERNACQSVQQHIQSAGEIVQVGEGEPTVAILGDSYVMGDGLADRLNGWAYTIGKTQGWGVRAAGISSTGYTNSGFCGGHSFPDRLPALLETNPEILIIQGGLNDWQAEASELEDVATTLLDSADDVPQVIVVGPANAPSRAEALPAVDDALRKVAAAHDRKYISALDWRLEFLPDGLHLTPAGHNDFAALVTEAIN